MSRPGALDRVRAALVARGAEIIEAPASAPGTARASVAAAAEARSIDAVLAAGGDGTIRQVAIAAGPRGLPVGIVPLGTGNVMAHEIGLPRAPDRLAAVLMEGELARIRGGIANGEPFFLWAGAGFDGRVIGALDLGWKRLVGRLAYGRAMARALRAGPDNLEVTIDGRRYRAAWVIVSNASKYGGGFSLTRRTRLTEPGLVTLLFRASSRPALLGALAALAVGALPRLETAGSLVDAHAGVRIRIDSLAPALVQIDGDPFGHTPLEVSAGGPEFELIVPGTRPAL